MTSTDHDDSRGAFSPDERTHVHRVLTLVQDVLKEDLLGVYMHGSAVLDGLGPYSDIDVFVVSAHRTRRERKELLVPRLLEMSGRPEVDPHRPIELTIVAQADVRPWRYPPVRDFQYGEWLRKDFEREDADAWNRQPDPDLASLITMVLRGDWTLAGAPPAEVLDPVPSTDYRTALRAAVPVVVQGLESDTRNMVLTLARIWYSIATLDILSKDGAATWALGRLPEQHRPVLLRARAIYRGEQEDHWRDIRRQVRPFASHVVSEIEQILPDAPPDTKPR
jgi:streptomycin 3"-adenylyltransferase